MFYDEARIYIKAGDGGDGCVAFRREKHVPFGGPSGGDGGRGGDVILVVDEHLNTLHRFSRQRRFLAGRGEHGRGKNQHGKGGEPLRIPVPPGTLVYDDESGDLLGDLVELDDELVVGQGGRGGRGNARFTTSTNQAPRIAEHGEGGTERWLRLELKLLADVGLVGVPNAGKSTLLAAVTAARPKIASYPFTTLEPNLGVVVLDDDTEFVLADIPGLIEGASEGKGLGHEFLRHVERTRLLVHLLDGMAPDPLSDFATINQELAAFGHGLAEKPQIVVLNKMDVPSVRDRWPEIERELVVQGHRPTSVSALSRERTTELLWRIARELSALPPAELKREVPVFRLDADAHTFSIGREEDGWRVSGVDIERMASMTVWNLDEAVQRFIYTLERTGIADALREVGAQPGDTIYVGDKELEWEE